LNTFTNTKGTEGYFRVGKSKNRWFFITPDNKPFFSIGLNHIDWNVLKSPDNIHIWKEKYDGDPIKWITESVVPYLKKWGFNTIGWVQEVVVIKHGMHRHSNSWNAPQYKAANMPYCHMVPVADVHQWDVETLRPDVFSSGFEDWCDFVARQDCVDLADDPNLIGYFFTDCPNWVHPSLDNGAIGPWFDPDMLSNEKGQQEFASAVNKYYKTVTDAIKRYDKNHLILGDRLEGNRPLPEIIITTAANYVDVLSFQMFGKAQLSSAFFTKVNQLTGLPVLQADSSAYGRKHASVDNISPKLEGEQYQKMMDIFFNNPSCIGWHYCGAYIRNEARKNGLKDRFDNEKEDLVIRMKEKNEEIINMTEQLYVKG